MEDYSEKDILISEIEVADGAILFAEKRGLPALALRVKGTTDSACYSCWRRYYACIFSGGTNCTSIGLNCNKVCKEANGLTQMFVAMTADELAEYVTSRQASG